MATQKKEQQEPVFEVGFCLHENDRISLSIGVDSHHVGIDTSPWDHKPGYYAKVVIFGLGPGDIQALGFSLIETSLLIKRDLLKSSAEKDKPPPGG